MASPLAAYRKKLAKGELTEDADQAAAAARLEDLAAALRRWNPDAWFGRKPPPQGLYLWGPVGRGKSMLMDIFFATAPVAKKRRVHFHEFMQARHAFLREARERGAGQDQLIADAAKQVSSQAQLLCFDEIQVTDIADAMILGRLFERLFADDVVIVATSNRPPDDLYKNGLNRQLFLPFIDLIKRKLDCIELAGPHDYRLRQLMAAPVWYAPLGPAADEAMDHAWLRLTAGAEPQAVTLDVGGRALRVEREAAGAARFTFEELRARPLGPADYLEIAGTLSHRAAAGHPESSIRPGAKRRRARTLIDALYEAKVKLVASAEAEPARLYPEGEQSFEFERTASRLMEMRSEAYSAAGGMRSGSRGSWSRRRAGAAGWRRRPAPDGRP
ncbi:MAG: cell division protein ZapE [Hyphomonadaceae bacterium]